jgi:hypothetical protein
MPMALGLGKIVKLNLSVNIHLASLSKYQTCIVKKTNMKRCVCIRIKIYLDISNTSAVIKQLWESNLQFTCMHTWIKHVFKKENTENYSFYNIHASKIKI